MSGGAKKSKAASSRRPGRPRKHPIDEAPERVAAYVPSVLAERLRVYTVRLKPRRSVSDVVSQAIAEYLDRND